LLIATFDSIRLGDRDMAFDIRRLPIRRAFGPRLALALVALAPLAATGCGLSGGSSGPARATVSLIAPTDGATVGVRKIEVYGRVEPASAEVVVAGHRVRVTNGVFRQPMMLHKRLTRIRVKATAKGAPGSTTVVRVGYVRRRRAHQRPIPTSPAATSVAAPPPPAQGAAPSPSQVGGVSEAEFVDSCSASSGNISLCTCMFDQLASSGFNTTAQWQAVVEDWRRSFLANGVITYPPVLKTAIVNCAQSAAGG
jgi:hypothetical protein